MTLASDGTVLGSFTSWRELKKYRNYTLGRPWTIVTT